MKIFGGLKEKAISKSNNMDYGDNSGEAGEIDKLLEGLNAQQREAVTTTEGCVRVIAGAGSGKTKALTLRYAYLVERLGINCSNILCVTFTNKAAVEMRNRIKRVVGDRDFGYITTYHGFCVKILREDIHKIQYPKQFVIMDIEDQNTALRDIYDELGLSSKDFSFKKMRNYIGNLKDHTNYIDYIIENKHIKRGDTLSIESVNPEDKVFLRYIDKQMRNFALDFDDLMNFVMYIFEKHNDVLEKWQKRLYYIQVDEMQDTSARQFEFVQLLSDVHKNLFVVGDPDQSIYEWRNSKPELLVDFDKTYPETRTIIMDQNYRSTPNILNLGNDVIKHNKIRIQKDMFTKNPEGSDVIHFHAKSDNEEGLYIASTIQRIAGEKKCKFSDFAILYRAHHASRVVEQSLIKKGIPYVIWGGIRFFERREIKDVLSYLRLVVFGDDLSFLRVINTPSRKLGKAFIRDLKQLSEQNNTTLFEALEANSLGRKTASEFVDLIKGFRERKDKALLSDFVREILLKTGLMGMYRGDGDEDRLDNIKELQNSIIALEGDGAEEITLENYLQEIALYTDMDVDGKSSDRVKLMTIHTAKGLEFPYVFLCQFTDGILPSYRALKDRRGRALEEERRLAYVAITRAEKALFMTESEGFNYETGLSKYPSRFLLKIKEGLYVRNGFLTKDIIDAANRQAKHTEPLIVQDFFEIGDIVEHFAFGEGKVVEKDDASGIYLIEFKNVVRPIRYEWGGLKIK